ncbi:MAG TPA: M3 family metallopeptidase [Tenuifilaceae bacterium]|jgi:peptidyl-dipeptidase Dcp|nr:M3 family metallopeptidase [Tenuifilaceae bacterium]HOC36789.1 M3 family metallopeptidase [Tenuifilaceae bacterium]HPA66608.1 M3 family metallopeptidase [Tenuifilaceae bacterium]HPM90348.1 M3 family metallopeptidase [Tenuifilaceae bacterium]HQM05376.1 M3 family metallopeptidase [Tenuifilaceae bacterium]
MSKNNLLIASAMLLFATLTAQGQEPSNPFFSVYSTPFQVPPFNLIAIEHYAPAFERGIEEQKKEIEAITSNPQAPNFENTILAFDKSGELLTKVSSVFYSLNSANTSPEMQKVARVISPLVTAHRDNINLNDKLFQRIKAVYMKRDSLKLDSLQKRTVEKYYNDFVRNGANLDEAAKARLREINQQLSELGLHFGENLLAETNKNFKLVIDNPADLDGLPKDIVDAAAITAKEFGLEGKWVFTLQKPSMIPFLQYAKNRNLREKLYTGYAMRCNNNDEFDNKSIMLQIVNLRAEKAKLLGYKTYADYSISNNMAKTPEAVYDFLNQVMEPALIAATRDRDDMQAIINREGGTFKLAPWDWWYYAEKLKKEKFNLDESELKPYFKLENVRDGMFYVANQLYGITFTRRTDLPIYHPDVEVFEVKNETGAHIGLLYLDYFPRAGKRVGAWCGRFRQQTYENGKRITPIVTMVTNFTPPTGNTPALLTWDEVTTLFHEFGHALHGLFTDGPYDRIAGSLPRDMVELPSQVMENWAGEPRVIKVYAKHYQNGSPMPEDLINRLKKSMTFNQGFETVEYIAASVLDLDWHSITEPQKVDVLQFENNSMKRIHLLDEIYPRYRTTYFNHIIGGYAAGYYVYLWAAVLDTDAFNAFAETGDIFNHEVATRFRKHVLTEGGNDEGMIQYVKFRGKEPSVEPLLKKRGFK